MVRSKVQLLSAGVSLLALGIVAPGVALAQSSFDQDNGVYQPDGGGVNLYTVSVDTTTGTIRVEDDGAASESFDVYVTCAVAGGVDCPGALATTPGGVVSWPGSVLQTASGEDFTNTVHVEDVALTIRADARATAATHADVSAIFREDAQGIRQYVDGVATGSNFITVDVGGSITVRADAVAVVTEEGDAAAFAAMYYGGILQSINETDEALNSVDNNGVINVLVNAEAVSVDDDATATALLEYAGLYQRITDAVDAENDIDNSGTISVIVTADANAQGAVGLGRANAYIDYGVLQEANGTSEASSNITNGGTIDVQVGAHAAGDSASAYARLYSAGIDQRAYVSGDEGVSSVTLANSGDINIGVDAGAVGDDSYANARAYMDTGINQDATAPDEASALITNSSGGAISITAHALAESSEPVTGAGPAFALASINTGIYQYASASSTETPVALASLENDGSILVGVTATANADVNAFAAAYLGTGIGQTASATEALDQADAAVNLVNDGSIAIRVGANAFADMSNSLGTPAASAVAYASTGIYQFADATAIEGDGTASATIGNTGTISVAVTANASTSPLLIDDSGSVDVIAYQAAYAVAGLGNGIYQSAFASGYDTVLDGYADSGVADILLDNSGTITVAALAQATGGAAYAIAYIDPGIVQVAYAYGGAVADASVSLPNSGDILIAASAVANGGLTANAAGVIGEGIYQFAYASVYDDDGDADASADLTNTGSIAIIAEAHAVATEFVTVNGTAADFGEAVAIGVLGGGIIQYAAAYATDLDDSATADADTADATVNLTNSLGNISIAAIADADGAGALAEAFVLVGVNQYAQAYADANAGAAASLSNSGVIAITANASATGSGVLFADGNGTTNPLPLTFGEAGAIAFMGVGIYQQAYAQAFDATEGDVVGSAVASADLDNSGSLLISAIANADAANAYAYGLIGAGVVQGARAVAGDSADADASLVNSGDIAIRAIADAAGITYAGAYADIGLGVVQSADAYSVAGGPASASISLINSGDISVIADASAVAGQLQVIGGASTADVYHPEAHAGALVGYGIVQYAQAYGATATYTTEAVTGGVATNYTYSGVATAADLLDNSGSITVAALAEATAAYARAYADVLFGIGQSAQATGGVDATAGVTLTNSGDIAIVAGADAIGTDYAGAYAGVFSGIAQGAYGYAYSNDAVATADLTNDGSIVIQASANANAHGTWPVVGYTDSVDGYAQAYAFIGQGIGQRGYASAYGLDTYVDVADTEAPDSYSYTGDAAVDVNLVNNGSISIAAIATADGGNAYARAYVVNGIYQGAYAFGATAADAAISLSNSGDITILASANAIVVNEDSYPYASAYAVVDVGIAQYAQAAAIAGDDVVITLPITQSGGTYVEYATGPNGPATAAVELDNSGLISIHAVANADNVETYGYGSAYAAVHQGIDQYASAFGTVSTATVDVNNDGVISIGADADVSGGGSAYAYALVGEGIGQAAYAGDDAAATLTNSGSAAILITAHAGVDANEPDYVDAYAAVHQGIDQYAQADNATASIANDGLIVVSADVTGVNASEGEGYAIAYVGTAIQQSAYGGSLADVSLINNGSILVSADATATADENAYADAHIDVLIDQYASVGAGEASVSLVNNGALIALANATGLAGHDLGFEASVGAIWQGANGGEDATANVSLVNNGQLVQSANAVGIGGGDGYAEAYAEGVYQYAYAGLGAVAAFTNATDADYVVSANASIHVGNLANKGDSAVAYATASGLYQEAYAVSGGMTFSGSFDVPVVASQTAFDQDVTLTYTYTFGESGPASATLINNGAFTVVANAEAVGQDEDVYADAQVNGVHQYVVGAPATALVVNTGSMLFSAGAIATGHEYATAFAGADGINQHVLAAAGTRTTQYVGTADLHLTQHEENTEIFGVVTDTRIYSGSDFGRGLAVASVVNSGSISVLADASAVASVGGGENPYPAVAEAYADLIDQQVAGGTAQALVDNSGSLVAQAIANATGATGAFASAYASGISQEAFSGRTDFTYRQVTGTTTTTGSEGHVNIHTGVWVTTEGSLNIAPTGVALAEVVNSGSLTVLAVANADGTDADAVAYAYGIFQHVYGLDASASVDNSGTILVHADAVATGGTANAAAFASGIYQDVNAVSYQWLYSGVNAPQGGITSTVFSSEAEGFASASIINSGSITVSAVADAVADTAAYAAATAYGAFQSVAGTDWNATFINSGDFNVVANANAENSGSLGSASAFASALGYELIASGGTVNYDNSGSFNVSAIAGIAAGTAGGLANAHAVGIDASAIGVGDPVAVGGGLDGTIDNSGDIRVVASADGGATDIADAHGVILRSGYNNLTVTNTGSLVVLAKTGTGGTQTSTGILVTDNGATTAAPTDLLTINNDDGTIIAAISSNNGSNWTRGMAIDVSLAPNPTLINLLGDGFVYGNIDLAATDNIVVDDTLTDANGDETVFDGIINPEFAPQPGVPIDGTQGGDPSPAFDGTLTINAGGSLFLVDDPTGNSMYDGPSQVYIGTFNTSGNLALELQTAGSQDEATEHYPQIFANEANLGGTLEIRINNQAIVGPLLYDDDVLYDNVIEADVRNGQFSGLIFTPPGPLINASIIYDANNNVDIGLHRTPFDVGCDQFDGTFNQCSTAGGIENVYSVALTGPFANVVAGLFTLNQAGYLDALDQLAGAQYASYLQGIRNSQFNVNTNISDQIDCAISLRAVDECRDQDGHGRFWIEGAYNNVKVDGDHEAGKYKVNGWSGLLGADYTWTNFTLGAFAGYRSLDFDMSWYNGDMKAKGWTLGLYAQYDVGNFYVRGIGSYSSLDGDSRRSIGFANIAGTAEGDPDVNVWSFYGEAGARFDMGSSWITPFAAVDHTSIKLKSFTETGLPGANLEADSETESQTSTLLGVKWAGQFGGIVPEAKVAWRHDFGDKVFEWSPEFADAPAGSEHRIISQSVKKDRLLVGLALNAAFGKNTTGRLGYQGQFNSDVTDHKLFGSLTFHFGGKAPPPAAPPPPPPPPPEPAPPPPPPIAAPGPFIVFFDWDKDEITPQAAAILDNAAAAYQQTGTAQVMLAGNADRSGSTQYNVGLSQRRADNVKSYLAGRGVPDGVMSTEAFGEGRPLVETADGVREPQNRNVQITFGPGSGQ